MHPLYDRSCENTKAKTEYSEEGTERLIFDEIHQQECWGELECCRELPLDVGIKSRRNLHLTTVSQLMVLHKSKIYWREKYRKCICIYAFITLQWQKILNGISIPIFWKLLAQRLSKCARVQKWVSPEITPEFSTMRWPQSALFLGLQISQIVFGENDSSKPLPNIVIMLADDLGWHDLSWHNPRVGDYAINSWTRASASNSENTI